MTSLNYSYNMNFSDSQLYGNDSNVDMYEFYAVPQLVFLAVVCVFIIVGNCFVLAAIRLSENGRKSRMNFFIMHLAIADLLVGVMVVITDMANKITVEWYAGNAMCKIIQYSQTAVTYCSTYMLVSLSIDRYDAVARPMNFSRSGLQGRFLVLVCWIVSLVFAAPSLYLFSESETDGKRQCWMELYEAWQWQLLFTIVFTVTFLIPAIIIASCYIAIIYIIWSKGRYHEPKGQNQRQDVNATHSRLIINESRHDTGRGIIPQAKIRTIKMTLIIVIVFIMCWSPFFIYNLLDVYELIPQRNSVATLIQSAAPLNSAANPIIYGIFSTRICKNLRRLPLPSCLRSITCHCQDSFCRRRSFRGRHNQYYTSQMTDPTMSTMDVHRRVDVKFFTSSKRGSRLGKLTACLNEVDRFVLLEAAQRLKNSEGSKKVNVSKMKGGQPVCEFVVDGDYELAPLAQCEAINRKCVSSGSDESPATSESNVVKTKDDVIYNDVQCRTAQCYTYQKSEKNTCLDRNEFSKPNHENCICFPVNILCNSEIDGNNLSNTKIKYFLEKPSQENQIYKTEPSGNEFDQVSVQGNVNEDTFQRKGEPQDHEDQDHEDQDHEDQHFTQPLHSSAGDEVFNPCDKTFDVYDDVSPETDVFGAKDIHVDRSCLATRRPSGVPSVRRRLTSDDNVVLKNATCQWTASEVSADVPSVVT